MLLLLLLLLTVVGDGKLSVKLPAAAAWILDTLGATPRLGGEVESTRAVNVPSRSFTLGLLFVD